MMNSFPQGERHLKALGLGMAVIDNMHVNGASISGNDRSVDVRYNISKMAP